MRQRSERSNRRWLAVVGIAAAAWLAYWFGTCRHEPPRGPMACMSNLRVIGTAVHLWMARHNGNGPRSLRALLDAGELDSPGVLLCPSSGSEPKEGGFVCDYDSIFDRAGGPVNLRDIDNAGGTPMVWGREPFHGSSKNPYRHVLYMDGSVRKVYGTDFEGPFPRPGE